ncbi:MAG: hypothetical protein ACYST6_07130 [Planctomycetota bacterium]|jgi:hypothetical protein
MKSKFIVTMLALVLVFALNVWAISVDGDLNPSTEYSGGDELPGTYGTCYTKYVSGTGFYICNDWWDADEDYDPDGADCDEYNVFDWTDTSSSPDMYYRLKVYGDGSHSFQKKPNQPGASWTSLTCGEISSASGYTGTVNKAANHAVWECKIPDDKLGSSWTCGLKDPVEPLDDDPANCPDYWKPEGTLWGDAPDMDGSK